MYHDLNNIDFTNNPNLRAKILRPAPRPEFDPTNPEHCASVINFIDHGKWLTRIDIQGATNVPLECLKKMAYYAAANVNAKR